MNQSDVIKRIFSVLVENKRVNTFFLYKEFSILPGDLVIAISDLVKRGWINESDNYLTLTKRGKIELYLNRKKYFFQYNNIWNDLPSSTDDAEVGNRTIKFDKNYLKKLEGRY